MKVDENILEEVLREAISDANKRPKGFIDQIKKMMFDMYNVTGGEVIDILNGRLPLEIMPTDTKFKITRVLYELNKRPDSTFDFNKLDIDIYFTEKNKDEFSNKIDRKIQDEDIVIKAGNWMQIEEDQFVIKIYPNDLMPNYINRNKINYNPETQRDLTIKETKTGDVKVITFDTDAFNDICESMGNNAYISDILALNVNPDLYISPKIVRGDIIIPAESKIDCIDGYHRLKSAVTTKLRKPEWNKPLVFFLFICDVDKAVQYILQQDKKIHLSNEQVTSSDSTDAANFIIKKINMNSLYLKNTIDKNKFVSLNKIINKLFQPKKLFNPSDIQDALELYNTIINNMNILIEQIGLYNLDITKEKWFIYLYILKHCMDNNLDFIATVNNLPMESLLENITFKNEPTKSNYKFISEVIKNA